MPSDEKHPVDAFGFSSDASAYVPRLALESALAELSELIGKTPACAALTGEAGLGKTLLLHVLHERLAGAFECLHVPSAAVDLWGWVAVTIGLGTGDDDRSAVLGRARSLAADGSGLVLLIDDAAALAASTRSDLIAACETPGLSLVLTFDTQELAELGSLPAQLRRIDLGPPMTLAETRAYVQARLRGSDPNGALHGNLGAEPFAELYEASDGVPARLHAWLGAWLRSPAAEPSPTSQAVEPAALPTATQEPAAGAPDHRVLELLGRLHDPRTQLGAALLFVILIGGFWYLALQRGGPPSVGVPVDAFEAPRLPPAELAPASPAPASALPTDPTPTPPDPGAAQPVTTAKHPFERVAPRLERSRAPDPS
jgi:hypothetical protein